MTDRIGSNDQTKKIHPAEAQYMVQTKRRVDRQQLSQGGDSSHGSRRKLEQTGTNNAPKHTCGQQTHTQQLTTPINWETVSSCTATPPVPAAAGVDKLRQQTCVQRWRPTDGSANRQQHVHTRRRCISASSSDNNLKTQPCLPCCLPSSPLQPR